MPWLLRQTKITCSLVALWILLILFNPSLHADSTDYISQQQLIFGKESHVISVGQNLKATIRLVNPNLAGENFGYFSVPTTDEYLTDRMDNQKLIDLFGVGKEYDINTRLEFVPPETGRGLMLPSSTNEIYRDILIKGTGAVEKFTQNNQLRLPSLGFDGYFEISEAIRDLEYAEILHHAGVWVSRGLFVIDHNQLIRRNGIESPLRVGNYVRAYRVQTRISNLANMEPEFRKKAIDDAILRLQEITYSKRPMNYVEYYFFILRRLAKNAAIYQGVNFTQDSLHYGQITLAGEMTDLGVGTFERPSSNKKINTKYPWFRFERQPLLIQNMLYRTHSLKAEPDPVQLNINSETVRDQNTLFSYIKSFDPEAANKIEKMNPLRTFWECYNQYYSNFNSTKFKKIQKGFEERIYEWRPEEVLSYWSSGERKKIIKVYEKMLANYSNGVERTGRSGPAMQITKLEKQRLFLRALIELGIDITQYLRKFLNFEWQLPGVPDSYIQYENQNKLKDLSWKPVDLDSFVTDKIAAHPVQKFVRPGSMQIGVGQKIIWMTANGVSPFALIKSISASKDSYNISYEDPLTENIVDQTVPASSVIKLNDFQKSLKVGDIVSGTDLKLTKPLKTRSKKLLKKLKIISIEKQDSEAQIKKKQILSLQQLIHFAYTNYSNSLEEMDLMVYKKQLQERLKNGKVIPLNLAMVKNCGNCMDQNLFTSVLLSRISNDFQFRYAAYIAKNSKGESHFFTIVTLLPSQEQYVLDSSFSGIRLFPLRQASIYSRFPITNIVDQHKPTVMAEGENYCSRIYGAAIGM